MSNDITSIPTKLLKAMRDLCPDGKELTEVTFSVAGQSVTLTKEAREKADAELRRRRMAGKGEVGKS